MTLQKPIKKTYTGLVSALALMMSLSAQSAYAQADEATSIADGDEIIVTARKRKESLQEVPLSITAFTGPALEEAGVESLRDLSYLTPGLAMLDFGAGVNQAPNIRGLTQSNTQGGENNVSIFIDGVYVFNFNAIDVSLLDIERIEVVKGPVSALYGRNAFAGVINYVTKKPGNATEGKVRATLGTHEKYALNAAIGGPIIDDKLSVRLAIGSNNFGGTWEDETNGRELGGFKKFGIQGSFVATPSDTVTFGGGFYRGDDEIDQPARAPLTGNCAPFNGVNREFCGRIPDGEASPPQAPARAIPGDTGNTRELLSVNLNASIDLGFGELDLLGGYTDVDFTRFSHFDSLSNGVTFNLTPGPGTADLSTYFGEGMLDTDYSFEARLSSKQDQPFRWTLGGYYYNLDRDSSTFLTVDGRDIPAGQTIGGFGGIFLTPDGGEVRERGRVVAGTEQVSGFAGVDFDISEKLTASAELRYTDETKSQDTLVNVVSLADDDGDGVGDTYTFWDTRLTLDYQATDSMLLYASAAKGTKAGGFNAGASIPEDRSFLPETNWTYEVGTKTDFANGRIRANLAAFYIDWADLQIVGIPADPNNPGLVLKNVGEATSYGFEADVSASITEGISWSGGLSYANPTFGDNAIDSSSRFSCSLIPSCASSIIDVEGRQVVNLDGNSLHRQSDWMFNTSLDFEYALSDNWDWFARSDYSYQSKQFAQVANFGYFAAKNIVNLRAGIRNDSISVTAWVDNALDDTEPGILGTATNLANFSQIQLPILQKRRTGGITVAYDF